MSNPLPSSSTKVASPLPALFDRYKAHISEGLKSNLPRDGLGLYDMLWYHMGLTDALTFIIMPRRQARQPAYLNR